MGVKGKLKFSNKAATSSHLQPHHWQTHRLKQKRSNFCATIPTDDDYLATSGFLKNLLSNPINLLFIQLLCYKSKYDP